METNLSGNISLNVTHGPPPFASPAAIAALSLLFTVIFCVGIVGNVLIIFVIMVDRKMRNSPTNMFIMNLAVADFIATILGIPEIVQFMINQGWLLGLGLCKCNRFIMVTALYVSVLTLVSVCVERFIAIVFPIKAHILCSRRKVIAAICTIWPIAVCCSLPNIIYLSLQPPAPGVPIVLCMLDFPGDPSRSNMTYKLLESIFYYFIPVILQIVLYTVVGKRLFVSSELLHAQQRSTQQNGGPGDKTSENLKVRRSVVIMLIACVITYIICYSPYQIFLIYNTIMQHPFHITWQIIVFTMIMVHTNSAANPIIYSVFSQKYRQRFHYYLCYVCMRSRGAKYERTNMESFDSRNSTRRTTISKTAVSSV